MPQPHTTLIHRAVASADKSMVVIEGASHYYAGQPRRLDPATAECRGWLAERNFLQPSIR